jgi:glycyl-tRNA synthetase
MSASPTKNMDEIVALCRRRGFIFQSSEIYGGINGFWDYGPLGAALKRNLKNAWWKDIVQCPANGPDGSTLDVVGVDCTILMNPKVWIASGHAAGFNDPMVDDKETKQRFRADHLMGLFQIDGKTSDQINEDISLLNQTGEVTNLPWPSAAFVAGSPGEVISAIEADPKAICFVTELGKKPKSAKKYDDPTVHAPIVQIEFRQGDPEHYVVVPVMKLCTIAPSNVPSPITGKKGSLTAPRQFNLMFDTYVGAVKDEDSKAWLRPETAQGIFCNFWNVVDTSRVKVPFGIAQVGKAFRNEVTPRNFTFRSREFEQMEIEFFIRPETAHEWYAWWRKARFEWWQRIGLAGDNLQLREHDKDELSHYAKEGAGVCDVEYRFPFTAPGFGELEGIAHRADFDLKAHAAACGKGDKLKYFDQDLQVKLQAQGLPKDQINEKSRYFPHVIEPSAGADRGTLALLCEAYTPDPSRPSGVYMKFAPRMAPIKAGIFPLVNKDGMPEVAEALYKSLRSKHALEFDEKQTIGKRYARMDEAGTPFCFTIDGDTLKDQTVTVRERDSAGQQRIGIGQVEAFLAEKIGE